MSPPPGLADPLRVAVVEVTPVAALVVTDGTTSGVVNDTLAPNEVPNVFEAIAQ